MALWSLLQYKRLNVTYDFQHCILSTSDKVHDSLEVCPQCEWKLGRTHEDPFWECSDQSNICETCCNIFKSKSHQDPNFQTAQRGYNCQVCFTEGLWIHSLVSFHMADIAKITMFKNGKQSISFYFYGPCSIVNCWHNQRVATLNDVRWVQREESEWINSSSDHYKKPCPIAEKSSANAGLICLPSGKLSHNYGKSPFYSWVNQLFQWPWLQVR